MNMGIVCILIALAVVHVTTASIVNVAQGKPVSMSSSKSGYSASTAVDGKTEAGGYGPGQTIDTGDGHPFAWWKVDLQREVQNTTVRIYFRTDFTWRRNGVKLYTSTSPFPTSNPTSQGQLCNTVTGDPSGSDIPDVYNVTCPGRWRYLLLYTNTNNGRYGPVLDFGEVEVLVCSDGTYGEDCTRTCSSRNCVTMPTTCGMDGICYDGCQSEWTGLDCTQACDVGINYGVSCRKSCSDRHCNQPSFECDTKTGECIDGCQVGWTGVDCTSQCPADTFGSNCTSCSTRHCQGESDCPADGTCSQGCQDGWIGNTCLQECSPGTYGPGCSMACSNCSSDEVCHHVTGSCPSGCKAGWRTDKCNEAYGSIQEPVCFGVASLVGAVVGTFLLVVLLGVGIIICLMRQGRLQWIKNPDDNKHVQESRDFTQMSSIAPRPSDVSEHAQSSNQVHNNDYAVLDTAQMQGKKDYDVIQPKHYQNL